ncbi:MAG: hypothetical protein K8R99_04065 [Actinomycetia bacterium]|nr:hypothetical protein [Actinomycetes bacterium]
MMPTPVFTPVAEPKPQMRRRWIIAGSVCAAVGVVALIAGGIMLLVSRASSTLDPVAESRTPGTATFTAENKEYDILLVTGRGEPAGSPEDFACEVTLADGRTFSIDGSSQSTSSEVGNTESVGSFDAVAGATSVFCETDGTTGNRFIIDTDGALARLSRLAFIAGGVLLAIGTGLILGGVFWKKRPQVVV